MFQRAVNTSVGCELFIEIIFKDFTRAGWIRGWSCVAITCFSRALSFFTSRITTMLYYSSDVLRVRLFICRTCVIAITQPTTTARSRYILSPPMVSILVSSSGPTSLCAADVSGFARIPRRQFSRGRNCRPRTGRTSNSLETDSAPKRITSPRDLIFLPGSSSVSLQAHELHRHREPESLGISTVKEGATAL